MLVHSERRRGRDTGLTRRARAWIPRGSPWATLAVLALVFLAGAAAHRQGALKVVPKTFGLSRSTLADPIAVLKDPKMRQALLRPRRLPMIHIDMAFRHYDKIEKKRRSAIEQGILFASDDDLVPAEIRFEGRTVPVKMRLKGDWVDHLTTDKWSYRIHVKGEDHLFGMRRFSIQHPQTRNYLAEWLWLENLRLEGLAAPRYKFVNVVFNGTPKGVYAVEEFFSKELLEADGRREGVIVTFDEASQWERRGQLGPDAYDPLFEWSITDAPPDLRREARVSRDSTLLSQWETAAGLLQAFQRGRLTAPEAFDVPDLGRFLAITELWEARHGLWWENLQFYFNPITGKLEPIGFDGTPQMGEVGHSLDALEVFWTRLALQDPQVAEAYVRELLRISRPDYYDRVRSALGESYDELELALYREFPDLRTAGSWSRLRRRQEYVRRSLDVRGMVMATSGRRIGEARTLLDVEIRNVLALPVEILGFQLSDSLLPAVPALEGTKERIYHRQEESTVVLDGVSPVSDGPILRGEWLPLEQRQVRSARFTLPTDVLESADGEVRSKIAVITRVLGSSLTDTALIHLQPSLAMGASLPPPPSLEELLARHPFLVKGAAPNELLVRQGSWRVSGDLVLPEGFRLRAGPAATLRFEPEAVLVARGPLEFRGRAEAPVVLAPADSSWAGVVVLEAKETSTWEHVVVENTQGIARGGWTTTGGITFYKSPLRLLRSRLVGSRAEDAINVLHTWFEFRESEFSGFVSDALDADFTEGVIRRSSFRGVGGDAIDLSGSRLRLADVAMRDIGDKGISAGEASQLEGTDIVIAEAGIGVASKDLSRVRLQRLTIEGAAHAALAAFIKKPEFGPAEIIVRGAELIDSRQETLIQTGSWIELNGRRIEGIELDIAALYEAGILGN